jgi:hypothetical protein
VEEIEKKLYEANTEIARLTEIIRRLEQQCHDCSWGKKEKSIEKDIIQLNININLIKESFDKFQTKIIDIVEKYKIESKNIVEAIRDKFTDKVTEVNGNLKELTGSARTWAIIGGAIVTFFFALLLFLSQKNLFNFSN